MKIKLLVTLFITGLLFTACNQGSDIPDNPEEAAEQAAEEAAEEGMDVDPATEGEPR